MPKTKNNGKLVEKAYGDFQSRYKSSSPNLDMKKQVSSAFKSRYSESLSPEKEIEITKNADFRSRY